jgi:hypothetical protein
LQQLLPDQTEPDPVEDLRIENERYFNQAAAAGDSVYFKVRFCPCFVDAISLFVALKYILADLRSRKSRQKHGGLVERAIGLEFGRF